VISTRRTILNERGLNERDMPVAEILVATGAPPTSITTSASNACFAGIKI
jgi:hypothetical protein